MKLDRSLNVKHSGRWRTPRLCRSPRTPFFALSSSSGPAASQLQSSCCFCIASHGPRFQVCPQGSPPPPCLCTFDNPAASRPAPPHGATLTGDRAQLVCMDHVHMLQACSSSNNKTHACWRPALGPTLLTLLPHSAGSMHVSLHLTPSPPPPPRRLSGSSLRSPTLPACPWLPKSLFRALPPPPYCPWAPRPRQPPPSAPAPQRPATPLPSSTPRDPCLKPPLTSLPVTHLLQGFSHCPLVNRFLSCFCCLRHLHFDVWQTRILTHP